MLYFKIARAKQEVFDKLKYLENLKEDRITGNTEQITDILNNLPDNMSGLIYYYFRPESYRGICMGLARENFLRKGVSLVLLHGGFSTDFLLRKLYINGIMNSINKPRKYIVRIVKKYG